MSEQNMQSGSSASSPLRKTIKLMFVLFILILSLQLYLNPPERRNEVLCLPSYKLFRFFRVTIPGIVVPKESDFIIEGITSSEKFYFSCKETSLSFPGFSE